MASIKNLIVRLDKRIKCFIITQGFGFLDFNLKNMTDSDNRKDSRRKKFQDNTHKKYDLPEEQRFINKSKKQLKKKIEDIRADEKWEDWDEE